MGRREWTNWAGNQRCRPALVERPRTEDEVAAVVRRAAADGRRVKVVGSGHSFTDIATTDGVLVDLRHLTGIVRVDADQGLVTVRAGTTLAELNRLLAARGLALPNLGDIAYQTVAGATSTGTHGTGRRFGNLSSGIVGLRLVDGAGEVRVGAPDDDAELLAVGRVGLGALGILTELTLRCVPAFNLHAIEEPVRVDAVLAEWEEILDREDHFEFFWVPNTGWALTKRNRRTTERVQPRSRWLRWRTEVLYDNLAFGLANRVARRRPSLTRRLGKALPSAGRVEYTEPSAQVFASPRHVRFYEMEYAVPLAAVPEALGRVRAFVAEERIPLLFPVEVRAVAADDIPLSPAHGRETGYLAVHVYRGTPFERYFEGVEAIMGELDGRPHWGKLHFLDAAELAPRYPEWARFQTARRRLDPDGRFANAYLERVLGP